MKPAALPDAGAGLLDADAGILVTGGLLAGRPVDVHLAGGLIRAVTAPGAGPGAAAVVDVGGAALVPGLHDHHVHLRAWAAVAASVPVGPPEVRNRDDLARALAGAPGPAGAWIRAVGYHGSVAGHLDRRDLDELSPDRPVRVQHRSGALWVLNTPALDAIGLDDPSPPGSQGTGPSTALPQGVERDGAGRPTGRLWRADRWLATRLPADRGSQDDALAGISRAAAARGVTGFTDATPDRDDAELAALASLASRGVVGQRLHLMAPAGATLEPAGGLVELGPVKVLLDDDRLPSIEELAATMRGAHRAGRGVAVHCVTRVQAVVALAAWEAAGPAPGDRMEHGAVLGDEHLALLRRMAVTVVTQPGFVAARGDQYLGEVEAGDLPDLWRLRSLLDAGVLVAAGTDAPLGPADPWACVRAAVERRTASGALLGADERIDHDRALALWAGHPAAPARPRRVSSGQPADLCAVRTADGRSVVVLTVAGGRILHQLGAGMTG